MNFSVSQRCSKFLIFFRLQVPKLISYLFRFRFLAFSFSPFFFTNITPGTGYNIFIWATRGTITFSSEIVREYKPRQPDISAMWEKSLVYYSLFLIFSRILFAFLDKRMRISIQLFRDVMLHFLAMKCIAFIILHAETTKRFRVARIFEFCVVAFALFFKMSYSYSCVCSTAMLNNPWSSLDIDNFRAWILPCECEFSVQLWSVLIRVARSLITSSIYFGTTRSLVYTLCRTSWSNLFEVLNWFPRHFLRPSARVPDSKTTKDQYRFRFIYCFIV